MKLAIKILSIITTISVLAWPINARELIKNIAFDRGQTSSTIQGNVVRGDRDVYVIRVKAGQVMSVKADAPEKNVAFSIVEPSTTEAISGTEEENEITSWSHVLNKTGEYRIIVGGTRGNATYTLQVSVK